jgi:hypothetical protein
MDITPRVKVRLVDGQVCWAIDWCDFFRTGVRTYDSFHPGEMRGFHVVFRIRAIGSGTLLFWDDDGSVIRRNGEIIHEDRSAHGLTAHEVEVSLGDLLEIAQWQLGWDWMWCGRIRSTQDDDAAPETEFLRMLPTVQERLRWPNGPVLKMYTSAAQPIRTAACIYSMILNGYTPSAVHLYGEDQWSSYSRGVIARLLPFVRVVPQHELLQHVRAFGGATLADLARKHWFVAKDFAALAAPPHEACLMDDDVFILDPVTDALAAFSECDLVYTPDQDLTEGYLKMWQRFLPSRGPLRTGRFNAGLYWIRNIPPAHLITSAVLRCRIDPPLSYLWEQGLVALLYADRPTCELPGQRYAFPLVDGLPGGIEGYDYVNNPCGFAAIHYAGLAEKPSDALAVQLLDAIASRDANVVVNCELTA